MAADVGNPFTVAEVAERIGRTMNAVLSRRSLLLRNGRPCPFWVTAGKGGDRDGLWFCDQGDFGHDGTCCGGKSLSTYIAQGGTWP